ncbi:MAG: hypothetical protein JRN39_02540 [Nitrososphaerota archaeon]|nr:hypothetical protein [Nitrososphaerota archaeon]MDG6939260.1 hypothetical protein [Nitrososphaerota archaeon]
MDKQRAAVYGTSLEGYRLALALASADCEIRVVDERMKASYLLGTKPPKSVQELLGEDTLYPIQPLSAALQDADLVVVAPRLRYSDEGKAEWFQRLKEIGQNVREKVLMVNLVPMPPGGNRNALKIFSEQAGFGQESYSYAYLPGGSTGSAAYSGAGDPPGWLSEALGVAEWGRDLELSELLHIRSVLSSYLPKALDASLYRDPGPGTTLPSTVFLDDLADGLYELQLLADTLQHGDALQHYATGALKAASGYMKMLESYLRLHARDKGLKAIRSKILIVWGHDPMEMKGERSRLLGSLLDSLREVFGEVDTWNPDSSEDDHRRPSSTERYQMVVACSRSDLEVCRSSIRKAPSQAIIGASVPVQEA